MAQGSVHRGFNSSAHNLGDILCVGVIASVTEEEHEVTRQAKRGLVSLLPRERGILMMMMFITVFPGD